MAKLTKSTNDQLMVMAAHRYSLGRSSYIVGACVEWLEQHWGQFTPNTQSVILRDTFQELVRPGGGGWECDRQAWQRLLLWGWQHITPEQQAWLVDATAHSGELLGYLSLISPLEHHEDATAQN
jgi:hypothetical protein